MSYVVRDSHLEESRKWPIYSWDICKRFGAEFYHTWRWEVFTSLLIAGVVYGITVYDDPQAWKNLLVTVQASAYVLGGFAVWHILRTPFLAGNGTAAKGFRSLGFWNIGNCGIGWAAAWHCLCK